MRQLCHPPLSCKNWLDREAFFLLSSRIMQIEITLHSQGGNYSAKDLGFLLHKHPDHLHERETASGRALIFFPETEDERTRAVLFLDVDPVALVRGRNRNAEGLLSQYVNDRSYVVNSFMSVALGRSFGQSMAGRSKERQELADRTLPFEVRMTPVAISGGEELARQLFEPLGYTLELKQLYGEENERRPLFDLHLSAEIRLCDLLNHLYVLGPVLDNAKHYWVDRDEAENLLAKGEGWLAHHPAKELIAKRALKHRRALAHFTLARLQEAIEPEIEEEEAEIEDVKEQAEDALEKPIRLHELRLDTVAEALKERDVRSVLDLGCGEGKLLRRLVKERGFERILGVDASITALERAADRLRLNDRRQDLRQRVSLQLGSLTYGDRRWMGFDAAVLVEVIEHIDPPRLSTLELALFQSACPRFVIITTPNRDYNSLFETMPAGTLRHADHRFEWTRAEFREWAERVAAECGYRVEIRPLGPEDAANGAPSQMAIFERNAAIRGAQ